jgi:hypothetical protein
MSALNSKIEFPRSSPDGMMTMGEKLLTAHDANPSKVNVPQEVIDTIRNNIARAKALRAESKSLAARAVALNGDADKILGIAIGQTLDDVTTVAGAVAEFRDFAYPAFKRDLEKLIGYGFDVTISIKPTRVAQKKEQTNKGKKA